MARWLKVDFTNQLRGRGMTAIRAQKRLAGTDDVRQTLGAAVLQTRSGSIALNGRRRR